MVEPRRAAARPLGATSPVTGETLLLEDEILLLIERKWQGVVWLTGGPGTGKSTALAHLATMLSPSSGVVLLDNMEQPWPTSEWCSHHTDKLAILCRHDGTPLKRRDRPPIGTLDR